MLTPTVEGVLPTYLPSSVISAPGGVELKLHLIFSRLTSAAAGDVACTGFTAFVAGVVELWVELWVERLWVEPADTAG